MAPGSEPNFRKHSRRTYLFVYCSHFLSAWGDRMWSFGVGVFLIRIASDNLQLPATYGLASALAVTLLGALVGDWIDTTPRLRAAQIALVSQNMMVTICAVGVYVYIQFDAEIMSRPGKWSVPLCHAAVILFGVLADLASMARSIAVERDWIVKICDTDTDLLANMTATLRRINQATWILAPLVTGQVMTFAGLQNGALFITFWNLGSLAVEYYLLWKVYTSVPALSIQKKAVAVLDEEKKLMNEVICTELSPPNTLTEADVSPASSQQDAGHLERSVTLPDSPDLSPNLRISPSTSVREDDKVSARTRNSCCSKAGHVKIDHDLVQEGKSDADVASFTLLSEESRSLMNTHDICVDVVGEKITPLLEEQSEEHERNLAAESPIHEKISTDVVNDNIRLNNVSENKVTNDHAETCSDFVDGSVAPCGEPRRTLITDNVTKDELDRTLITDNITKDSDADFVDVNMPSSLHRTSEEPEDSTCINMISPEAEALHDDKVNNKDDGDDDQRDLHHDSHHKNETRNCCRGIRFRRVLHQFITLYQGWRTYMSYKVSLAGLALASLYMTVLGFDNITVAYAVTQGVSESIVGILMGASAIFGILATFIYPVLRRRTGLARTGLIAVSTQVACLSLCVVSVWLPGSPFDPFKVKANAPIANGALGSSLTMANTTAAFQSVNGRSATQMMITTPESFLNPRQKISAGNSMKETSNDTIDNISKSWLSHTPIPSSKDPSSKTRQTEREPSYHSLDRGLQSKTSAIHSSLVVGKDRKVSADLGTNDIAQGVTDSSLDQPEPTVNEDTESGSYLSIIFLMAGIVLSRCGLYTADLAITQLFLEAVVEGERGVVSGVQNSLNMLMEVLKFALVVAVPDTHTYGFLIIISFSFICLGWLLYSCFFRGVGVRRPREGLCCNCC